jgi:hypothetical protein
MALDALNAAAAAVVLNNADANTRTQGVVVAALCPGALGLAVPLVMAQQGGLGAAAPRAAAGPRLVAVPDVSNAANPDAADARLTADGLAPRRVLVYSNEIAQNTIISQDPAPNSIVRVGSTVTVRVSQGVLPQPPAQVDVDADLTNKINAARDDIEAKMNANAAAVTAQLTAISQAIANLQPANQARTSPSNKSGG